MERELETKIALLTQCIKMQNEQMKEMVQAMKILADYVKALERRIEES